LDKSDPASVEKFYNMTIAKVGLVVKRDLGEDLYNELYPGKELKSEEDFRNHVRQEIQQQWDSQSKNHLQHELYHHLNEHSSMEFPETFLRRWMKEGQEKPKTDDEVEAEFPTFRNQLRWTLVSDRIVKAQDIQVSREEVMNQLRQQIMGYFGGMSLDGNLDWLDGYVDRMMQDEQQVDGAYRRALTEKIFNWAEAQITPEEKEISAEDFANMLKVHQHEH
jgi:trigger factor